MFITWPDNWYHSSLDTPDKQDSTQYKRAAVVATGAVAVLATGGDEMTAAHNEAVVAIRHQTAVEKGVVRSAHVLFNNPADGEKKGQAFEPLIDRRGAVLLDEAKAVYTLQATQRKTPAGRRRPW